MVVDDDLSSIAQSEGADSVYSEAGDLSQRLTDDSSIGRLMTLTTTMVNTSKVSRDATMLAFLSCYEVHDPLFHKYLMKWADMDTATEHIQDWSAFLTPVKPLRLL